MRAETLCPPFLVCNARLIEPIIVLIPELGDDLGTSGVLRRSGFGFFNGGGRGGDSGAIIVMYDSAGGYSSPRIKLTGSSISCGAGPVSGSIANIGSRSSRTESEKLPLRLWLWLWYGCRDTMGDTGDPGVS